jgi:hypothetical protein
MSFPKSRSLVIWETGISDAVRGIDTDEFAAALQTGIDELKNRAIDILLVDMQFLPPGLHRDRFRTLS